ncbi:MAG: enoyl-CoA hydratase/isomerase family protein [Myxococcota bacterium]
MSASFCGHALSWSRVDDALEVELNRAPANELGTTTVRELEQLVEYVGSGAGGARALIWHSTLDRGFSAGADLRELHAGLVERTERQTAAVDRWTDALPDRAARLVERGAKRVAAPLIRRRVGQFIDRIHAVFDALDQAPLTTIAAVHGVCLGGGLEWALTADIIVADKSARFGFPELRLGLIPGFGGIPRLERDVGAAVVRDLLFTGRTIRASRAFELGLVSQVVARGEALHVARQVAKQAARFDPAVVAQAKAFVKPLPASRLQEEKATFLRMVTDPTVFESLTRFVEDQGPMPWLPGGST